MRDHNYFIYITTNPGITNDLPTRLSQHQENRGNPETFAGKYHCYNLIYWERFQYVEHAIEREKELKKWSRTKRKR